MSRLKFRSDIEGLRGVLVLLVMLFHAGFEAFEGAYLSVDIFFLISGYLMAVIITQEQAEGRFTLLAFYDRRARRLMPALYLVLFASLLISYTLLPPKEYALAGSSVQWSLALSVNSFFAASTDGYFASETALQPLMHLWTLSLEQQFYLVIPLVFLLVHRFLPKYTTSVVVVIIAVSLLRAEYLIEREPQYTFYALETRLWEFLAGVVLALKEADGATRVPRHLHRWLSDAGAVLVIACLALADVGWRHPGFITVVPIIGAAIMLAYSGAGGFAERVLSWRALIWVGTLSYSLYLWHQVFFAAARWYFQNALSGGMYFLLIAVSMVAAFLTYKLVEAPARQRKKVPGRYFWPLLVLSTVLINVTAQYVVKKHGLAERFPASVTAVYSEESGFRPFGITADKRNCFTMQPGEHCRVGDERAEAHWAMVGDSHAAALISAFDRALRDRQEAGFVSVRNTCAYVLDVRLFGQYDDSCREHNRQVSMLLADDSVRNVLLMARYPYFLSRKAYNNWEGGVELGRQWWFAPLDPAGSEAERIERVLSAYKRTVEALLGQGKRVILVYPLPEFGWNVPRYYFKARRSQRELPPLSITLARYLERASAVQDVFDSIPDNPRLVRIRPQELFCRPDGRCYAEDAGTLLYRDDDHLNHFGAERLMAEIMRRMVPDE